MEQWLGPFVARTVRDGRRAFGWTQRELADRAGVSQSAVSRTERRVVDFVSLAEVAGLLDALSIRIDASVRVPLVAGGPAERDATHVRLLTHADGRFRRCGFETAREVPVGRDRVRGWIDLLAWRARDRTVLMVEVKSDIYDVGTLERQVAWYERETWDAARTLGWRPSRVVVACLALASKHNADLVRTHADAFRHRFPSSPAQLAALLVGQVLGPGSRTLAFIDPRRRHRSWLLPTPLSGGRPVLPYADAAQLRNVLGMR